MTAGVYQSPLIGGLTYSLYRNDVGLAVEADGYVGRFDSVEDEVVLCAHLPPDTPYRAINVDGAKNVQPKRDHAADYNVEGHLFQARIQIKEENFGRFLHTEYPNNGFRFLLPLLSNVEMWELSLISQGGEFFLINHLARRFECFRFRNRVRCPLFEKEKEWPQILPFVTDLFQAADLPPMREYGGYEIPPSPEGLDEGEAVVHWYNCAQGLGAVVTDKGKYARVHWTEIPMREPSRFRYLEPGEVVSYERLESAPDRQTKNRPTEFRWEAVGVSPTGYVLETDHS